MTLDQVNLLLAKAYSVATARKSDSAQQKVNPSWGTGLLLQKYLAFQLNADSEKFVRVLEQNVDV